MKRIIPLLGFVLALALAAEAIAAPAADGPTISSDQYQVTMRPDGRITVKDAGGRVLLAGMTAAADFVDGRGGRRTVSGSGQAERQVETAEVDTPLGPAEQLTIVTHKPRQPALTQVWRVYASQPFLTVNVSLSAVPPGWSRWRLKSLDPLRADGFASGLALGPDAARYVILDNGSHLYLDVITSIHRAGRPPLPAALLGPTSVSNWSSAIYDPATGRSAVIGFLGANALDQVLAGVPLGGRLCTFGASARERPPRPLKPGETITADTVYLDLASNPFDGLEGYADALGRALGVRPWPGPVPSGWNSWGEYHQDIDERIILDNLDFAASNLAPFGMRYFQIDDGYAPAWGDWDKPSPRFPHGMKWLADQIKARGMIPGIWIGPFEADVRSEFFAAHRDWFLPRDGVIARNLIDKELRVLDLTRPEVLDYLRALTRMYVKDWGYGWLKIDFAYYFMYHSQVPGSDASMISAYRAALRVIRDEAGPDVFIVGIGPTGAHYGLFDAERITLDNMPAYNNYPTNFSLDPKNPRPGLLQGLVPTARTISRRYFLNHRVWINHPDMFFFDNDRGPDWANEPITFSQARAFASLVGMTGGIVKLGDRLVDLKPREVDVVRRLLPVYPRSGRPLDLFEKETPERWLLQAETGWDRWQVLGLFNWGENWSFGRALPVRHRLRADFAALGLPPGTRRLVFDFWNEKFLGEVADGFDVALEPGDAGVFCLREPRPHPWFLAWNRQLTMGAVLLPEVRWDEKWLALSGRQDAVAGYDYHLFFHCPAGFEFVSAEVGDTPVEASADDRLVRLRFRPAAGGETAWRLVFRRSDSGG